MVGELETLIKCFLNIVKVWILLYVVAVQLVLEFNLDHLWQSMLQEGAHFSTIGAMSITDREEMAMTKPHDVWVGYVSILVYLVRVVG